MQVSPKTDRLKNFDFYSRIQELSKKKEGVNSTPKPSKPVQDSPTHSSSDIGGDHGKELPLEHLVNL